MEKLSKNKVRFYFVLVIIFILFTVIAFAVPFNMNAVFWLSYIFAVIAIAAQIYAYPKAFDGKDTRSKFYGFPLAKLTTIYMIAQLVLSLIFMAVATWIPAWVAVILYVLLLGVTAVGFISVDAMRDEVQRQDVVLKANVSTMRGLQSKADFILGQTDNADLKKALNRLAEQFRYSDPVSSEALTEVEANLSSTVDELQSAVMDKDIDSAITLCARAEVQLAERNRLCKLGK
jgi:hypothetical protein